MPYIYTHDANGPLYILVYYYDIYTRGSPAENARGSNESKKICEKRLGVLFGAGPLAGGIFGYRSTRAGATRTQHRQLLEIIKMTDPSAISSEIAQLESAV